MIRRMGRPGLLGTMARTAVVAGTATAVTGGMRRRSDARATQQQQAAEAQQQQMVDQAAVQAQTQLAAQAPAPSGGTDRITKLKELAQLRDSGVLDEAEFAAEKARILQS